MAEYLVSKEDASENLLACAAFLAERIKSSDGHAEATKAILPFYLRKNDVDTAAALADSVADPFTRDRLLMRVVEKCAAIDDDDYAFQLVEAIEERGLQGQARELVALEKSKKGEFEKAFEIASTLEHPDNVYADIAIQADEKGEEATSSEAVGQIEYPLAKAVALQTIAQTEIQRGEKAKSLAKLETALEAAKDIDFTEEKIRALCEIANHFVEANRNDRAIETFDLARSVAETLDNVHREAFLSQIAYGFFHAGSIDLADRTLDLVTDKTQLASTLLGFARVYWQKGEKDDAQETLDEAYAILKSQHEKETRDSRARFALYAGLAAEYARFEKGERAIEIAQEIPEENEQMSALASIATILASMEKDEIAHQAAQAIPEDLQKMLALIGISDAKNRLEKRAEALKFLHEAYYHSGLVRQMASRSAAFNALARRFDEYGESEKARQITHENLETITQIRDESSRVMCLASLAELFEEKNFALTGEETEVLQQMIRKAEL